MTAVDLILMSWMIKTILGESLIRHSWYYVQEMYAGATKVRKESC